MTCDFYPLIKNSKETISWSASQYDEPESQSGIILAFRREECPFESATVSLGGIQGDKLYEFTDVDTNAMLSLMGSDLIKYGMKLRIPNKRQSILIKYTYR